MSAPFFQKGGLRGFRSRLVVNNIYDLIKNDLALNLHNSFPLIERLILPEIKRRLTAESAVVRCLARCTRDLCIPLVIKDFGDLWIVATCNFSMLRR